jgi:hypothetical protein
MTLLARDKPISPAAARNYLLLNQLGTPGLGSIWGGRWIAGCLQLLCALAGFCLVAAWMALTLNESYQLMSSSGEPRSFARLGIAGAVIFGVAWFWSLATSISLVRDARRQANAAWAAGDMKVPPRYS